MVAFWLLFRLFLPLALFPVGPMDFPNLELPFFPNRPPPPPPEQRSVAELFAVVTMMLLLANIAMDESWEHWRHQKTAVAHAHLDRR